MAEELKHNDNLAPLKGASLLTDAAKSAGYHFYDNFPMIIPQQEDSSCTFLTSNNGLEKTLIDNSHFVSEVDKISSRTNNSIFLPAFYFKSNKEVKPTESLEYFGLWYLD